MKIKDFFKEATFFFFFIVLASSVMAMDTDGLFDVSGYEEAFILLNSDSLQALDEITNLIKKENGVVKHVFPPKVLIAKISPVLSKKLRESEYVSEIYYNRIKPHMIHSNSYKTSEAENADDNSSSYAEKTGNEKIIDSAVRAWNKRYEPKQPLMFPEPKPILNDALIVPEEALSKDYQKPLSARTPNRVNSISNFPPFGFFETSKFMIGSTAVGIVFVDSNGSIDPESEDWTEGEESNVVSEIMDGLGWYVDKETDANISWTYIIKTGVPTGYEPITRPRTDEELWINDALGFLGQGNDDPDDYFEDVRKYDNYLRDTFGTDWAFTIFVVDSSNDDDGEFSDGFFAYAYLNGPFTVITYDNDGYGISNMDAVIAHEVGHIFGAVDQYAGSGCTCTETAGYLNVANQNCENSCLSDVASLMRGGTSSFTEGAIDFYARGQLGWRDSDVDGVLDPIELSDTVAPALERAEVSSDNEFGVFVGSPISFRALVNDVYSGIDSNSCEYRLTDGSDWVEGFYDGTNYCSAETVNVSSSSSLNILFRVLDFAGNQGTVTTSLDRTVDISPPLVSNTQFSKTFIKNEDAVLFTANVSDVGSDVNSLSVFVHVQRPDGNDSWGTALMFDDGSNGDVNGGDGVYSRNIVMSGLSDGNYFIDITASDNVDNLVEKDNEGLLTVDATVPVAPVFDSLPAYIAVNTVDLNWTGNPGSDAFSGIDFYALWRIAGEAWENIFTTTDANQTFYSDKNLADENYSYKMQLFDKVGNDSNSEIVSVVVDTLPPTTTPIFPLGWQNQDFNVGLFVSDGNGIGVDKLLYRVDDGNEEETDDFALIPITVDGNHVISFHAIDGLGLIEPGKLIYALRDNEIPDVNVFEPLDGNMEVVVNKLAFDVNKIRFSDINKDSIGIEINGLKSLFFDPLADCEGLDGNFFCSYDENALNEHEKDYNISISASDEAGNNVSKLVGIKFLDIAPPVLSGLGPSGTLTSSSANLIVSTSENAGCRFSVQDINYDSMQQVFSDGNGLLEHSHHLSGLANGNHKYFVSCSDLTGNFSGNRIISFSVNVATGGGSSDGSGGGGGGGGSGGGGGGFGGFSGSSSSEQRAINESGMLKEEAENVFEIVKEFSLEEFFDIGDEIQVFNDLNFDDRDKAYWNRNRLNEILKTMPSVEKESSTGVSLSQPVSSSHTRLFGNLSENEVVQESIEIKKDVNKIILTFGDENKTLFVYKIKNSFETGLEKKAYIVEDIPKELVKSARSLKIDTTNGFIVLQDDPVIAWNIKESGKEVNYGFATDSTIDLNSIKSSIIGFKETKEPLKELKKIKPVSGEKKETEKTPKSQEFTASTGLFGFTQDPKNIIITALIFLIIVLTSYLMKKKTTIKKGEKKK